ncbi:MAG: LPS export ABC transporter periplasmic protein LptC [Candidatus Marinimicrobia bacterium]|nr:LPS export ABC transporter periplasmic protein LptC [Candidatus Neomarinimicrobiota bacterium]
MRIPQLYKILTILAILSIVTACDNQREEEEITDSETELMPDQESWNTQIILTSSGRKIALVKAGHIIKFDKKNVLIMDEGLTVDFFNDQDIHTSQLTADAGEVNERLNDLTATGNVVVVSDSGETLHTEKLLWSNRRQKIFSELDVMITTGTDTLYGVGFESDAALNSWTIKKPKGKTTRLVGKDDEI